MKKLIPNMILMIACGLSSYAFASRETGNGGDSTAIEFKSIGFAVVTQLRENGITSLETIKIDDFNAKLNKANVTSTMTPLVLKNERKDAINYPAKNEILVFIPGWQKLNLVSKRQLVIHEVMGLMNVDDSSYAHSINFEKVASLRPAPKLTEGEKVTDAEKKVGWRHAYRGTFTVLWYDDYTSAVVGGSVAENLYALIPTAKVQLANGYNKKSTEHVNCYSHGADYWCSLNVDTYGGVEPSKSFEAAKPVFSKNPAYENNLRFRDSSSRLLVSGDLKTVHLQVKGANALFVIYRMKNVGGMSATNAVQISGEDASCAAWGYVTGSELTQPNMTSIDCHFYTWKF